MEVDRMLEMLYRRARHAKWSLFGLFFGISCFLTLSLVIMISMFFLATVQLVLIVTIFVVGMAAMLVGVWYEVAEMWTSFKGLALEYSIYRNRNKK
jgi:VIT1/CCC1 family predicted Fe2+/Mn2+ transporter